MHTTDSSPNPDARLIDYARNASATFGTVRKFWADKAAATIVHYYPLNAAVIMAEWKAMVHELGEKRFHSLPSPATGLQISSASSDGWHGFDLK